MARVVEKSNFVGSQWQIYSKTVKNHESGVIFDDFCDRFCANLEIVSYHVPLVVIYIFISFYRVYKWKLGLLSRANLFSCKNCTTFVFTTFFTSAEISAKISKDTLFSTSSFCHLPMYAWQSSIQNRISLVLNDSYTQKQSKFTNPGLFLMISATVSAQILKLCLTTCLSTNDCTTCHPCLPYVMLANFDQIFTTHSRHVGECGIKFWRNFVQTPARSGIFKKWSFFGEKYQYQYEAFPWCCFQFLKAKCWIGHVDKVVQLQKTRRLHTLLARFGKVEIFTFFGWGGPRPWKMWKFRLFANRASKVCKRRVFWSWTTLSTWPIQNFALKNWKQRQGNASYWYWYFSPKKLHFLKMPDLGGCLDEIAPKFYPTFSHMSTMCGKNLVEIGPQDIG